MLIDPPIDALIKKVGNQYNLAVIAGKRAKFLQRRPVCEFQPLPSPQVTVAINEIYAGKVVAEQPSEEN